MERVIIDWTRERCDAPCNGSYNKRAMGFVGSDGEQTCVETLNRPNSSTTSFYNRFQIHVSSIYSKIFRFNSSFSRASFSQHRRYHKGRSYTNAQR